MMRECYICGRTDWIESHHIFGGPYRKASERHGLVVDLCHWCHNEPPVGAHHNKHTAFRLKREGQRRFEQTHTREEFMATFGKNYLEEET